MGRVLPILFSTDMVQAILDGRKTVTRRVVKKQQCLLLGKCEPSELAKSEFIPYDGMSMKEYLSGTYKSPYKAGDTLYVRETWNFVYEMDDFDRPIYETGGYVYCADDPMPFSHWVDTGTGDHKDRMPWRPSIHMPKEAARIWLKVTGVQMERLQSMNGRDILREGVNCHVHPEAHYFDGNQKMMFAELWDSTIRKSELKRYGWDANPWEWVIEFERCDKPE